MQTPWEYRYANRTQRMGSSVIRELLKLTEQPDIISFGGGLPAPEVFPIKQFQEACNYVLEHDGPQSLQYLSLIHISEPTRLGMNSYAVFCLKKKKKIYKN